jgi:imidazolonepropionase-like amidohydrolase
MGTLHETGDPAHDGLRMWPLNRFSNYLLFYFPTENVSKFFESFMVQGTYTMYLSTTSNNRVVRLTIAHSLRALFATAILFACAAALADAPLVIEGARIVTGAGPVIDKGSIAIVDGKISSVGVTCEAIPGATVIDGKGLTVYPGLIDAYCLAGVAAPPAAPAAPTTQPEAPAPSSQQRAAQRRRQAQNAPQPAPMIWRKATEGFKSTSEALAALRSNGYTAALFGVRGVLTPGQDVLMSLAPGDPTASIINERAAINVNLQSRGGGAYPGTLMGAFAFVKQALYDGIDYQNRSSSKPDPRLETLGLAGAGKIPTIIAANSENDINRALRMAAEFKFRGIILGGREAAKNAARLSAAKAAVILTDDWSPAVALSKAGIAFALGSSKLEMSASEANELRSKAIELVSKGLAEEVVLAALTRMPAEILGVGDQLGVIAAGRPANLVLAEGSLFRKEGKVRSVIIAGRRVDPVAVKTAGGPKPRALAEDGVPFTTVSEDDADSDGQGGGK